jgi:hypothetical protein
MFAMPSIDAEDSGNKKEMNLETEPGPREYHAVSLTGCYIDSFKETKMMRKFDVCSTFAASSKSLCHL